MTFAHFSPVGLQRFWLWATVFFLALWGLATWTGWVESVAFVSHVSMIALVLATASSWQAARAEVRADPESPNP